MFIAHEAYVTLSHLRHNKYKGSEDAHTRTTYFAVSLHWMTQTQIKEKIWSMLDRTHTDQARMAFP